MTQPYLFIAIVIITICILQILYDLHKRHLSYRLWIDQLALIYDVTERRIRDRLSHLGEVNSHLEIQEEIEPLLTDGNVSYATISTLRTPKELRRIGADAQMLIDLPEMMYEDYFYIENIDKTRKKVDNEDKNN